MSPTVALPRATGNEWSTSAVGTTVTVVVPVYNEAPTIERVVDEVRARLQAEGLAFEVLVLNDGSTDWSDALEGRLASRPDVRLVNFQSNQGKGATLNRGFPLLASQVAVVIDADGEYLAEDIPSVVEPLLRGEADWVSGSRYGFDRPRPRQYLTTWWINRAINLWFFLWSGIRFHDILSGLYAFRTELVDGLTLREKRFSYTPELIWKIARKPELRFCEVPISYRFRTYAEGKKIQWWETVTILWAILRYRMIR